MIELFQLPPIWGLPNASPASMKLETWLRIAEIPYETKPPDMAQAPKGKVPYIRHEGVLIGDSTLILEHLTKAYGKDPDQKLTPAERATSLAFRRMLKESFYWVIVNSRWNDEGNWPEYKAAFRSMLPPGLPEPVYEQIIAQSRAGMLEQLRGHGMGRHSPDEIRSFGKAEIGAISDFLGDKPFFFGEAPTTADATVYAYVANLLECPLREPVKDYGLRRENLVAYTRRMRERFFPEKDRA